MLSATLLTGVLLLGGVALQGSPDGSVGIEEEGVPGDALTLEEGPPPPSPVLWQPPTSARTSGAAAASGAAVAFLAAGGYAARRRRKASELFPADVAVVLVGGWGSDSDFGFQQITTHLGIPPGQVVYFDYKVVGGSKRASSSEIAKALDQLVRSENPQLRGRQVYLIGNSKGGASVAELVASWDHKPGSRPYQVIGAALLDPPIADGALGDVQSLGMRLLGIVPNDGGFDPEVCPPHPANAACYDKRDHLGRRSGTDVVVLRSPDTLGITSFNRTPAGLEVVTIDDPGDSPIRETLRPLPGIVVSSPTAVATNSLYRGTKRVMEAHAYVQKSNQTWKRIGQEIASNHRLPPMKRGRWMRLPKRPRNRKRMGHYVT